LAGARQVDYSIEVGIRYLFRLEKGRGPLGPVGVLLYHRHHEQIRDSLEWLDNPAWTTGRAARLGDAGSVLEGQEADCGVRKGQRHDGVHEAAPPAGRRLQAVPGIHGEGHESSRREGPSDLCEDRVLRWSEGM